MGPANHQQFVGVVELLGDVLTEGVAGASGRDAPAAALVGVGPQEVAHGALVGHLLQTIELANVVERVGGGREAPVQTEETILDRCRQRQVIK